MDEESENIRPTELDDLSHRELLMMYSECATSIRYAKSKQWHTLAGALAFYIILGILANNLSKEDFLYKVCLGLSTFVTVCAIYGLIIYQTWQNNERRKLHYIAECLSSHLRKIRAITSSAETKFHRYTLFFFMLIALLIANWLLILEVYRQSF